MPLELSVISNNKQDVRLLLQIKKDLRRELIDFFCSLDRIWGNLPPNADSARKIEILREIVNKYVLEIDQNSSFINRQLCDFLSAKYLVQCETCKNECNRIANIEKEKLKEEKHQALKEKFLDIERLNEDNEQLKRNNEELTARNNKMDKRIRTLSDNIQNRYNSLSDIRNKLNEISLEIGSAKTIIFSRDLTLPEESKKKIESKITEILEILDKQ